MSDDNLQKWIDASIKATELKFALENILTNTFSHEEMQSIKYRQLLDTVDQYLEHVMSQYRKEKEDKLLNSCNNELEKLIKDNDRLKKDNDKIKKSKALFSVKSATIASLGAVTLEVCKFVYNIIKGG